MTNPAVTMHPSRVKTIQRRHPWIFSGALTEVHGAPQDGDIVDVRSEAGGFLARGYWNNRSSIRVRVLTWDEAETVDSAFWRVRLQRAIAARSVENRVYAHGTVNACRLVNAESDGIPGLIVDRYGDWLVVQALTLGIDVRKQEIVDLLADLLKPAGIYERSDVDVREKEGLPPASGVLYGKEPPELLELDENGRRFLVDVRAGHKTGFYLDQRENRAAIGEWFREDAHADQRVVVNAFAFTGGFAVYALEGLAQRVINIDTSADALALAKQNVALNGFQTRDEDYVHGDVFEVLRTYRDMGQQFDMIILDPPKFAHSSRQVESAARGYKDINMLAFRLLKPGGMLATFSCSGAISADLFQKIVFSAVIDTGRDAQIVRYLAQASDHPVALTFPEGAYLKGLLCRVW